MDAHRETATHDRVGKIMQVLPLLFLLFAPAVVAADDTAAAPFVDKTIEAAQQQAAIEKKLVLVFLAESEGRQTEAYEKIVFVDENVLAWMKEHVIAVRFLAEQQPLLMADHGVRRTPAVLMLTPEGGLRMLVMGFRRPKDLLAKLEGGRSGSGMIEAARQRLAAAGNKPAARLSYAKALEDAGEYKEALEQYEICCDEVPTGDQMQVGPRLLAIRELARLGDSFPPALDALRSRRDAVRDRILDNKASKVDPRLLAEFNLALDDIEDTLEVYGKLEANHPTSLTVHLLRDSAVDALIETRRYDKVIRLMDVPGQLAAAHKLLREDLNAALGDGSSVQRFHDFLRTQFVSRNVRLYEVLVGSGWTEEAAAAAELLLEVDNGAETYQKLAAAGLHTGKPTASHAEQARKALAKAAPPTAALLQTYVEILVKLDRKADARKAIDEFLPRISDDVERARAEKLRSRLR